MTTETRPQDTLGYITHHDTGSRVVCDPPVTDTDLDTVVLVQHVAAAYSYLLAAGWNNPGARSLQGVFPFVSLRNGVHNYILTDNPDLYARFRAYTVVATRLKVSRKQDRVLLAQAVLYGFSSHVEYYA